MGTEKRDVTVSVSFTVKRISVREKIWSDIRYWAIAYGWVKIENLLWYRIQNELSISFTHYNVTVEPEKKAITKLLRVEGGGGWEATAAISHKNIWFLIF